MTDDQDIESNPSGTDIIQGFALTRSAPKGYGKFLKTYKSVNNAPFLLDATDVTGSIRILILSHFEIYPANLNEAAEVDMWSRSEDQAYFNELVEKESSNLMIAAGSHLGTHTAKVPNPGVTGPGGLFADKALFEAASRNTRVSSAAFAAKQRVGAAGNAAQGKAQRFLASRVKIGDDVIDVSEDIAAKGRIYDAMVALGFAEPLLQELSAVLAARLAGCGDTTPGLNAKGLIWPTDEGDIVITPVHSYAMHVELAARVKSRQMDPACRIATTHIVVGGTKPQNAGLINSDMGGWHRLLEARPPTVSNRGQRKLFRIAKTGRIPLAALPGTNAAVQDFVKIANAVWANNDTARTKLESSITRLVRIAVTPLAEAASLGSDVLKGSDFKKVSKPILTLLVEGYRKVDDTDALVQSISDEVINQLPNTVAFSDALRRLFQNATEEVLSSTFKGV